MTLGSMKTTTAAAALLACLVGTAIVKAQQATEKPLLSDQVFKNVTVMKGIPVDQFMGTMGFFSSSLNDQIVQGLKLARFMERAS